MANVPTGEVWLPVVGFEGLYEVSDQGRVQSLPHLVPTGWSGKRMTTGRVLTSKPGYGGYVQTQLWRDGKVHKVRVHTLVLTAFVGPCPPDHEALHGPGGPADNRLSNLRWGTSSENKYDIVRAGNHHRAKSETCIRDHKLSGPNLKLSRHKGRVFRQCRACQKAASKVRYEKSQGRHADLATLADQNYRYLMGAENASHLAS